jgi:hypothetical protein
MKRSKKRSTPYGVYAVCITILTIATLVVLIGSMSDVRLHQIGTDGFYTDVVHKGYAAYPWVLACVLSLLVLLLFFITEGGNPKNMEEDSEEGTTHV